VLLINLCDIQTVMILAIAVDLISCGHAFTIEIILLWFFEEISTID
jgi:hypothetical protein